MADARVSVLEAKLARKPGRLSLIIFAAVLLGGIAYTGGSLLSDLSQLRNTPGFEFLLLGLTLAIALGFEFVNGFHDTANAVATVIYTHSLEPHLAVVWSGLWNFIGVLTSSGAVAFGIVSLLPVELILNAGTHAGFAMIFALLFSAILWNLGTWYFGLPNSSSHTLIGSILGVGLMNQWMAPLHSGVSGVDWTQAIGVGKSLFFSPLIGFVCSALLFLLIKRCVRDPRLYSEPVGKAPPPFWIRSMLVLTCTGVSYAHGSNDGQKGMGLIMLILVGTVPAAYALNHAVSGPEVQAFLAISERTGRILEHYRPAGVEAPAKIRPVLERLVSQSSMEPQTVPALTAVISRIAADVAPYRALASVPIELSGNIRNDMYLADEALGVVEAKHLLPLSAADAEAIRDYRRTIDRAAKFIPTWVKVAVALALGLGTMVGWKRIVVTVGERIGKTHLTYAQGAASEVIAMATILAADRAGMPVSTTHVLTSGVAGTMAANHSGLQWSTLRALAAAWLMTLPASVALAASLFWVFRHIM
uniref:Phosphate transporter n=1 Tax=Solibacter usitatus (strain Ellin6076) TaxID=234267 RepID=Q021B6_SOLUE